MRIDGTSISMPNLSQHSTEGQWQRSEQADAIALQQNQSAVDKKDTKEQLEQAIDSLNEFFTINNSELKFVFHEGLDTYYAQLVNSETHEVIREIPSKKCLMYFMKCKSS